MGIKHPTNTPFVKGRNRSRANLNTIVAWSPLTLMPRYQAIGFRLFSVDSDNQCQPVLVKDIE
jgi:hypothetical protein